ncbi:MAG TPA: DinB family protein [Thermomicrobiales bacterium]|nr:DinB family protein [Thermomicrobiales bacterium]
MLESYRELLDLLAQAPMKLRAAADAAGDPPAGEWSAAQVMAHMAAAEKLWFDRLNAIMHSPDPVLKPPGGEIAAMQERLMGSSVENNIEEFNSLRGETVSLLMGLSLRDWDKSGIHETRGEMSIADVVEGAIDHDAEHLGQLNALA